MKVTNYRDVDSFKSRKSFEEREARKESKYKHRIEDWLDIEDDIVDIQLDSD